MLSISCCSNVFISRKLGCLSPSCLSNSGFLGISGLKITNCGGGGGGGLVGLGIWYQPRSGKRCTGLRLISASLSSQGTLRHLRTCLSHPVTWRNFHRFAASMLFSTLRLYSIINKTGLPILSIWNSLYLWFSKHTVKISLDQHCCNVNISPSPRPKTVFKHDFFHRLEKVSICI